ncbi:MAG: NADP-dependent malic enzyme [Candidatus Thiodiazotropha sp.]
MKLRSERPEDFEDAVLEYHRMPSPGKLTVEPTKPLESPRDLALAFSPGVAAACNAITADPFQAAELTARQNLVGMISNGTAVLGLGEIGGLAAKPVLEGKAMLFKRFANINVFDIELGESDPQVFIETVAHMEPTFGGIHLEGIKAPECFVIEQALRARMNIPVYHDDQHGTAMAVCAAVINGLRVANKKLQACRLVTAGAGVSAIPCLDLLMAMGLPRENIIATDSQGVIYQGREAGLNPWKERYSADTQARTLADAIAGADIFLGLSVGDVLSAAMLESMAEQPLVLALANPAPEITPELAKATRPDVIIATSRSDCPNQVNNALCFPFIFRGALDVGATTINDAMKLACVNAIADLAMAEPVERVTRVYGEQGLQFGPDYLIPKPFDPRLITEIAPAVAKAAMETGVATRPIDDMSAYTARLSNFVYRSSSLMRPVIERARKDPRRIVYAEGEERRVLQAVQQVVDEGIAYPVLIGRPGVIENRIRQLGLRLRAGRDFELVNIDDDPRYNDYWQLYLQLSRRQGVSQDKARIDVRTNRTIIASLMVQKGDADGMLCGTVGKFTNHLQWIERVIGKGPGVRGLFTVTGLILPKRNLFICDTHITADPDVEELVDMTLLAAKEVRAFGITPKVALLSRSNFGTHNNTSSVKMREALVLLQNLAPDLEIEGEMQADAAVSEAVRQGIFGESRLKGSANLLIMPNVDAANIAFSLLKQVGRGVTVGPILIGANKPAHILTEASGVRRLVNMSAVAVTQAQLGMKRPPVLGRSAQAR